MKTARWLSILGFCSVAAQAADLRAVAPAEAPPVFEPVWLSSFNTEFRYFSFGGTKGQATGNAVTGVRGSGSQFYLPFGYSLTGQPSQDVKIELTARGGYTDSRQTTLGLRGVESTALDTQLSGTLTYLGLAGAQPFVSLNLNLPTGDTFLTGNRFRARLDSDLVDIPTFGEGFNIGPTVGVNVPITETLLFTIGVGYTARGRYDREGPTDAVSGFITPVRTQPSDSATINAGLSYQEGAFAANLSVTYSFDGDTLINGTKALRSGERLSVSGYAVYAWSDMWTTTLSSSFTHTENNFVQGGALGVLVKEAFNSNSNLYRVGLDTLYRAGALGVGPSLSFLYRDNNAFDARNLLFVPARERYGVGGVAQYAYSENTALNLRVERIFVHEDASPDKLLVTGLPVFPGTGQPRLSYTGWSVAGGVTISF